MIVIFLLLSILNGLFFLILWLIPNHSGMTESNFWIYLASFTFLIVGSITCYCQSNLRKLKAFAFAPDDETLIDGV